MEQARQVLGFERPAAVAARAGVDTRKQTAVVGHQPGIHRPVIHGTQHPHVGGHGVPLAVGTDQVKLEGTQHAPVQLLHAEALVPDE